MTTVPCMELANLSEAQRRAYILADNKLALNAGWDHELLKLELADLRNFAMDLLTIGSSADELKTRCPRSKKRWCGATAAITRNSTA
jgi:ParB-like chromosome segregation protein Spo0J